MNIKKELEFNTEENSTHSVASTLIALCFESRNKAHIAHLQTTSYSAHKALDDYYHLIVDLSDGFAESYQGRYGVISDYPDARINCSSSVRIVEIVRDWVDANRIECGTFPELQNTIDDIVKLCNDTIYKLTNLK